MSKMGRGGGGGVVVETLGMWEAVAMGGGWNGWVWGGGGGRVDGGVVGMTMEMMVLDDSSNGQQLY